MKIFWFILGVFIILEGGNSLILFEEGSSVGITWYLDLLGDCRFYKDFYVETG